MDVSTVAGYQVIPATNYAAFFFPYEAGKQGHSAIVTIHVKDANADLNFLWLDYNQYLLWNNWFVQRFINGNQYLEKPRLNIEREYRAAKFNEEFDLTKGNAYALILDNTYSQFRLKTIMFSVTTKWNTQKPLQALPVINKEIIHLPSQITEILMKANDCYVSGHYEQCSVMIRKAVDFAIRLKLLQSGLTDDDLLDAKGNELTLSNKIKLLRKKNLITAITAKHLEDVKWYGDIAAHSPMRLVLEDIRDSAEPKVRAFLTGLALKT